MVKIRQQIRIWKVVMRFFSLFVLLYTPQYIQAGEYDGFDLYCSVITNNPVPGAKVCVEDNNYDSGRVQCGEGYTCPAGTTCRGNQCCGYCSTYGCIPVGSDECRGYSYRPGYKCVSGRRCILADDVDCGNGKSCSAGNICLSNGCYDESEVTYCGGNRYCGVVHSHQDTMPKGLTKVGLGADTLGYGVGFPILQKSG